MQIINYVSICAIPMVMLIIILYSFLEKKKTYDLFLDGAKEGMNNAIKLIPTLIGLFVAVGVLRSSGILDFIIEIISPIFSVIGIPTELLPLAFLRPISGSASMAIGIDVMKKYGVDSFLGNIAAIIMGSTETTFYVLTIYTSVVGVKKIRFVLIAALLADLIGIITAIIVWGIMA